MNYLRVAQVHVRVAQLHRMWRFNSSDTKGPSKRLGGGKPRNSTTSRRGSDQRSTVSKWRAAIHSSSAAALTRKAAQLKFCPLSPPPHVHGVARTPENLGVLDVEIQNLSSSTTTAPAADPLNDWVTLQLDAKPSSSTAPPPLSAAASSFLAASYSTSAAKDPCKPTDKKPEASPGKDSKNPDKDKSSDVLADDSPEAFTSIPPIEVSPLVRLFRWTFLAIGIVYGFFRRRYLAEIEEERREAREQKQMELQVRLKEEKRIRAENEAKALEILSEPVRTSD